MACSRSCWDSNVRDDNSVLTVDLTNPDIYYDQKLVLGKDTLHIVRTLFLWRATAHQRFCISNHGELPVALTVSFVFASDFADIFEARGIRRERRGTLRAQVSDQTVTLNYKGLDGGLRRSELEIRSRAHGFHQRGRVLQHQARTTRTAIDLRRGELRRRCRIRTRAFLQGNDLGFARKKDNGERYHHCR